MSLSVAVRSYYPNSLETHIQTFVLLSLLPLLSILLQSIGFHKISITTKTTNNRSDSIEPLEFQRHFTKTLSNLAFPFVLSGR